MLKAGVGYVSVLLTLERLQQEDCALRATLDFIVRTYLKVNQQGLRRSLSV